MSAQPAPPSWLEELQELALRYPALGVGPDLAALSTIELWGVLQYLRRLAAG